MSSIQETKELLAQMGGHLSHIRCDMNEMKITQAQMLEHSKSVDTHLERLNSKVATNVANIEKNRTAHEDTKLEVGKFIASTNESLSMIKEYIKESSTKRRKDIAITLTIITLLSGVFYWAMKGMIHEVVNDVWKDKITNNVATVYAND